MVRPPRPAKPSRRARRGGWFGALVKWALIVGVVVPVAWTALYGLIPPPVTFLMARRALLDGEGMDYRWRGLGDISPDLVRAVISSEDAKFCTHSGFDQAAIEQALENNEKRPARIKGGSTISQQTAKNAFLWPDRSYVRKAVEAGFTVLMELFWSKARVMEVYLNIVEWGPGVYGAEAASQQWFGKSAKELTRLEAAKLAAILPSPRRYKATASGPYVRRRARAIQGRMGVVQRDGLAACVISSKTN